MVWHKNITGYEVLKLSVSLTYCWQHAVLGTPHMVTSWRGKRRVPTDDPKSATVHSAVVKLKCSLVTYLPKSMEKRVPETCNIGKRALRILYCGKWFLIDFLISCLNLCCLALTVLANFLLCKYDRSILITCPKCLIKLHYPANHKLANRRLLPQNVTNYGLDLNKESNHSCSFSWVW